MTNRILLAVAFFAALGSTTNFVHQFGNACSGGSGQINGNWYCSNSVKAITFTGFQQAGNYDRVIDMDSGQCTQDPQTFGSSLGPYGKGNDVCRNAKFSVEDIMLTFDVDLLALSRTTSA